MGDRKTFGGDGHIYYLDCGDGNMGICPNSPNYVHLLYAFLYTNYPTK